MSDTAPPKIEFPCRYPIKVMGLAGETFQAAAISIIERHAGAVATNDITVRDSSAGNYQSVTVTIIATGTDQLQAIFEDLKTHELVKLVL